MTHIISLVGQRFNNLTVIEQAPKKGKRIMWRCRCDCGGEITTRCDSLKTGHTVSCGCVGKSKLDLGREKHGRYKTRAYSTWQSMKSRCLNERDDSYHDYGGRGITVCNEWMNFENFYADMGDPGDGETIDRMDNNEGYCKSNCRWASSHQQSRNKRSNIVIKWQGQEKILSDWAEHLSINVATLYARIVRYGWSVERAFTRPISKNKMREF